MLTEFFAWWGEQLSTLAPDFARRWVSGSHRRVVLAYSSVSVGPLSKPSADIVEALVQGHDGVGTLGRFALDVQGLGGLSTVVQQAAQRPEATLRLPRGMILEKTIAMPLAAQRDLVRIVEFELDHETPFTPDEVYWSVAIVSRDRSLGQVCARLGLVLKRDIDPILQKLRSAGITLSALTDADDTVRIRLTPETGASRLFGGFPTTGGVGGLIALVAILTVAAVISPFARQSIALGQARSAIVALQSDADAAQVLRRQIGGDSGDRSDPQTAMGNPLLVLAAVTDALPDDTYLTDFTEHHRDVELIGQSAAAAALIERLSNSPVLKDPSFSAPVTRDEGTGADDFAIKLGLRSP